MKKTIQGLAFGLAGILFSVVPAWAESNAAPEGFAGRLLVAEVGTAIKAPIQFERNSSRLTPASRALLNDVTVELLRAEASHLHYLVEGHTDVSGGYDYNLALSKKRANAVRNYLIAQGIQADRLQAMGRSYDQLIPELPMNDSRHRRVLFKRLQ